MTDSETDRIMNHHRPLFLEFFAKVISEIAYFDHDEIVDIFQQSSGQLHPRRNTVTQHGVLGMKARVTRRTFKLYVNEHLKPPHLT